MNNRVGLYATACETSIHRNKIDVWLNEGRSNMWISKELARLGEKISDKSIAKYKSYRETHIEKELSKDPLYTAQIQKANETLVDEVSKIKQVNVMAHISQTIEHCAELVARSKEEDIKIKNIQDLRFVQSTMLESLKLYGDMILKAQQWQKIEDDPSLLKPQVSVNVKEVLKDFLGGMTGDQQFLLIDRLRAGIGNAVEGRLSGDIEPDRPDQLDGDEQDIEGESVLVHES